MSDMNVFARKAQIAFWVMLGLYVLQLALLVLAATVLAPTHKSPNLVAAVFVIIPLLLVFPWLIRRNIRASIWLCFMQLGYFMPAVQHMFMVEQYGWVPFAETAVIIALFVVGMLFARWEQRRFGISVTR